MSWWTIVGTAIPITAGRPLLGQKDAVHNTTSVCSLYCPCMFLVQRALRADFWTRHLSKHFFLIEEQEVSPHIGVENHVDTSRPPVHGLLVQESWSVV